MFLIVNGDDFGFSHGVNEGIIKAHTEGILTSTSLMVSGNAFEEAVNLALNYKGLAVGLHLVLCCGKSVLSPEEIPHLVDKNGNFSNSPFLAGLNYQFNADARKELKLEIRAQLERFKNTGLNMSHVDGHLHLHCHPVVLNYLVELAPEFDIKYIRLPLEELDINLGINPENKLMKMVYSWVFGRLREYGDRLLSSHNIRFSDRVYGLLETANMNEDYLLKLIPQMSGKIVEIYSHPAITIEGEPINGNPGSGEIELQAYLSDKVREMVIKNGWKLTNYQGL
jgi:chitin disaccharide deacetylase